MLRTERESAHAKLVARITSRYIQCLSQINKYGKISSLIRLGELAPLAKKLVIMKLDRHHNRVHSYTINKGLLLSD